MCWPAVFHVLWLGPGGRVCCDFICPDYISALSDTGSVRVHSTPGFTDNISLRAEMSFPIGFTDSALRYVHSYTFMWVWEGNLIFYVKGWQSIEVGKSNLALVQVLFLNFNVFSASKWPCREVSIVRHNSEKANQQNLLSLSSSKSIQMFKGTSDVSISEN